RRDGGLRLRHGHSGQAGGSDQRWRHAPTPRLQRASGISRLHQPGGAGFDRALGGAVLPAVTERDVGRGTRVTCAEGRFGERNNMKRSVCGVLGCLAVVASLACSGEDIEAGGTGSGGSGGSSAAPSVTFTKDIHPILQAKCGTSGCHDMPNLFMPGHGAADVNVAYTEATSMGS